MQFEKVASSELPKAALAHNSQQVVDPSPIPPLNGQIAPSGAFLFLKGFELCFCP